MSSQAIELQGHGELQREWFSADQVLHRVRAVQKLMEAVMKKDTHYGVIPGTKKPTLYKAGSEQILAMFQIASEPIVEDLSTEDECRIRVLCRLTSIASSRYLGSGVGEASSSEQKYMWRKIVSKAEWEWFLKNKPESTRIRFFSYWDNGRRQEGEEQQVRAHVPDIRNTILKMAKKRAQIDATLTVTGCSDMFEQDLEDLPEEIQEQVVSENRTAPEPIKPTTKKNPTSTVAPNAAEVVPPGKDRPQPAGDIKYISEPALKRLFAIQGAAGMSDDTLKKWLATKGVHSRKLIPVELYNETIDYIDPEFAHHEKPENF